MAQTGWSELLFANMADGTAFNNSAAEGSLLTGINDQPVLPAFLFESQKGYGKTLTIKAEGVLGTTSTPTIVFQVRLGTTAGAAFLSGTSVGVSAAITTTSTVTNVWWGLELDLTVRTPGIGTGNATLSGAGKVWSPAGFATPFVYPLEPTTPNTATWTATLDGGLNQYLNISTTWGTQNSLNTITLKKLMAILWN